MTNSSSLDMCLSGLDPKTASTTLYNELQVSMLSRLRHPCVLEVVEPLEETR